MVCMQEWLMQEWLIHSMQECLVVCIYAEVARRLIVCMQEWLIVCMLGAACCVDIACRSYSVSVITVSMQE